MSLGSNIRKKRKSLKYSQEYVAEQMQISRQAVSKWEMGQSEPSTTNLVKLSELFSCDVNELLSSGEYCKGKEVEDNQSLKNGEFQVKSYHFSFIHLILTLILFSTKFVSHENAVLVTILFLLLVNLSCFYSEYLVLKYFQIHPHKKTNKRYAFCMMIQIFITVSIFIVFRLLF